MWADYLSIALLMMQAKPVRSTLSLLGIYFGVLALVIILSIGAGMRQKLDDTYSTRGARVVFIESGYDAAVRKHGVITPYDLSEIRSQPEVLSVETRTHVVMEVQAPHVSHSPKVIGVDDQFIGLYRIQTTRGRAFFETEIAHDQPVCMISVQEAHVLFPLEDPIGQTVVIGGKGFHVIGVVNWDMDTGLRTSEMEVGVLVPVPWMLHQDPQDKGTIKLAEVRVRPGINSTQSVAMIQLILSHGNASRNKLFIVRSMEQYMESTRQTAERVQASLLGIAAISLLVGGIGVANVMVISITERTREIGTRKALGARRIDILLQFLVESMVLCATGGLLAVVTGIVVVNLTETVIKLSTPMSLSGMTVVSCWMLTVVIGLIAGVYPASRAALLSPADALRYE